jgi:hypothetical protein
MAKHTLYHELREAMQTPGCAVCRLAVKAVTRYAAGIVYEAANDSEVQDDVLKAWGWCNLHAWQLTNQTGAAFDVAILYRSTLRTFLRILKSCEREAPADDQNGPIAWLRAAVGSGEAGEGPALVEALAPRAQCPACRLRAQTEKAYIETLLEHIGDAEISAPFERGGGLCLPHFRRTLEQKPNAGQLQALIGLQRAATEHLHAELQEFIRKHDHRYQNEPMEAEGDSWLRMVAQISGSRGVW